MSRLNKRKAAACLILALFSVVVILGGCGSSKYEAVSLESSESDGEGSQSGSSSGGGTVSSNETAAGTENTGSAAPETMVSLTLGGNPESGDGSNSKGSSGGSGEEQEPGEGAGETEPADPYEAVDEVVVVTADVLNVRESEIPGARIYAQLKGGSTLRRTGYSSEWSRVIYDGKTAYVSSSMVEVQEPETNASEPEEEVPAAAGAEAAMASDGVPAADGSFAGPEGDPEGIGMYTRNVADEAPEVPFNGHTVAIDAGHQAKANAEKEPIGPGSDSMKAKMPAGFVGVSSGAKECELTLAVAQKLEKEMKARGYHVVMIRESNDVNLSNAERAAIANKSEAEIFIRLHANSMDNSGVYGALAMCMTGQNPYNAGLHDQSYTLSKKIIDSICSQTGTKNRGVQEVDNSSIINWSEIPVSVVEMGFMSNPDEDRWMQNEGYQDKIVAGIISAVDSYFAEGN